MQSQVYVNWGRVVADCPYGCGTAYRIEYGTEAMRCDGDGGCGQSFSLIIPDNLEAIMRELVKRPLPNTRNWFPDGHKMALENHLPHGQSVADLAAERELESVPTEETVRSEEWLG